MRILLADDHALFRDGIASLLGAWDHEVVGQVSDGEAAVVMALELVPDLVLMDVSMPRGGGVAATREIAAAAPGIAIVMLTASEDADDLFAALKAGARGYLVKNLEAGELRRMLDAVARGEAAITPAIAARIIAELARGGAATPGGGGRPAGSGGPAAPAVPRDPDRLTDREVEVLRGVVAGRRNKEIAGDLGVSENTV
ncbi:MAG: response regulator transcription factor, partial [Chloroflexota bacterium]